MNNLTQPSSNNNGFAAWQADPLNSNQNFIEALFYAERGFAVFPVDNKRSLSRATANIDTLAEWWRANPNAKCGLALGARKGLIAIKFDDNFINAVREAGIGEHRDSSAVWSEAVNKVSINGQHDWLDNWRVAIKENQRDQSQEPVWNTYL